MRPSQGGAGQDRGRKAPPTADPPEQEKKRLEERLQQAEDALRQLEAELQAFQKSCLLQLARSSWVGRVLRSSTGSVEVSLAMGGPPAHPPWSAGCPLQTGASTQGPWPPWRPASWTRDEQPSLWSLPPGSQQVCVYVRAPCVEAVATPGCKHILLYEGPWWVVRLTVCLSASP